MKAVVYRGPNQVAVEDEKQTDYVMCADIFPTANNRQLRDLIRAGRAKPSFIVSHELKLDQAPDAYQHFDVRDHGWTKVVLHPGTWPGRT